MDKEQIEEKIEEFRIDFLGEKWLWRKGQVEAIIEIISAYYNGTKIIILSAPTGSGKSLIAMAVSYILNQNKKTGYILASDIALQEQYQKDFDRFHVNWGNIKGIDNYLCVDNMEKNSLGTCRIRNKQPRSMHCYSDCPYFSARDHAAETSTTLLNYAYWLIMMNYVFEKSEDPLFAPRDFTFCDESHKLLDIIQNHYSPRLDRTNFIEKLDKLTHFFDVYKLRNHSRNFQAIKVSVNSLFEIDNQDKLLAVLSNIEENLECYLSTAVKFKDAVEVQYHHETPPKEWRNALWLCDWLKDVHCKIEDYVEIITKTSTRNLIKNPVSSDELVFNCLEESYLMHKYFHKWNNFTVLMSATFADPSDYIKSIALSNAKYIKMASSFDFTKSPIYFYNKRRMSYNQIESNLPWLCDKINEILDNHYDERGIIHSSSYDLALKIYNRLTPKNKKRVLIYNGTEEKRQVLEVLKRKKGMVLLGPSLMEGLDLKDEWSRFQIIAKVPYLSLGDMFVKTKMNINPNWYRWKAVINILQSTGRSVRSETDWAITYILDGSLADLIHNNRKAFPIEFIQRLQVVNE
jgi:Rad3-related DNA helicase